MAHRAHGSKTEVLWEEENIPMRKKISFLGITEEKIMSILSVSITSQWLLFMNDKYSK